jgi:hypothetical protein
MDEKTEALMKRKTFAPEHIIEKLREAEVLLSQGQTIGAASRKLEVKEKTYYRWSREHRGIQVEQARRLKEFEREDARLKKPVAGRSPFEVAQAPRASIRNEQLGAAPVTPCTLKTI